MASRSRLMGGANLTPKLSTPPEGLSTVTVKPVNSDLVVILATLLCALICVLGLVTVSRCTWIRRIYGRTVASPPEAAHSPRPANRGLKKKVLKSLPKLTYGEDGEYAGKLADDCAICLAEFASGEEIRVMPQCGHGFHVGCIDMWLESRSSCPSCRQIFVAARCQNCGSFPVAASDGACLENAA
ncbi:RING-H2 finger protein ATL8-like, partial [Primulina huaijiensis]|uniref:RING-H2 finger protein ATL8-like n=1 Tax=Primulina huaijiensis TaxID=1492673 RepID=UPI003CC7682D